jgi:arabinofuranan 3-O-arabinosyltransferase
VARRLAPLLPAILIAPLALAIHYTADFGLAYQGGVEAWNSGHPQRLVTWTATPFLAVVMALVSRVASVDVAARAFMAVDLIVWGVLLAAVWGRLRDRVSPRFWWSTLLAAAIFAPAISTIFWLQPNLIVFGLALVGFVLVGRRDPAAGLLIGLSVALKPIVVLLPLALLLRRQTREAGIWAIATAAVLSFAGLGFLAWRAGDLSVLNPLDYLAGFLGKGRGPIAACVLENYSPVALLCRLGLQPSILVTVAVAAALLLIGWLLIRRVPDWPEARFEIFALACLISGMLGPIDWAHYGILMAPLFLLLSYQLWSEHAPPPLWIALGLAFLLAELVWDPLESLAQAPVAVVVVSYSAGQFSQYVLLLTWVRWRQLRLAVNRPGPAGQSL